MKKSKILLILIFLLILYTFFCAISYAESISYELSDQLFRLHVIANSDSEEDQSLKYKVRDSLLEYMNSLTTNCTTKDEVISIANDNLNNFENIAKSVILENGFDYDVNVEIGNFEFPTKTYGDISLPSGYYDALRVKIGNASGKNWWCVMFPPLCFVDVSSGIVDEKSKDYLKDNLSEESYSLISNNEDSNIKFKFKLLELFNNNNSLIANK